MYVFVCVFVCVCVCVCVCEKYEYVYACVCVRMDARTCAVNQSIAIETTLIEFYIAQGLKT